MTTEQRIAHLKYQIEVAEIHGDWKHRSQCERELRQLDKCLDCPYLQVTSVPSLSGDGYGQSYQTCDPPEGECRLDC